MFINTGRVTNRVDTDQIPLSAALIWVYTFCKGLSVPILRVNMVIVMSDYLLDNHQLNAYLEIG